MSRLLAVIALLSALAAAPARADDPSAAPPSAPEADGARRERLHTEWERLSPDEKDRLRERWRERRGR